MAYLSYVQVAATNKVQQAGDLTIPGGATHVELQAETQDVRYTMDGSTPPTETSGMILQNGLTPKSFLIEDLRKIRFIRSGAADAVLNLHYFGGRDV